MPSYFPIFLNLEGRHCLVIGGNRHAAEKAMSLAACGARVTVLASAMVDELTEAALLGEIEWIRRDYRPGDLKGYFLAVTAPDDRGTNAEIFREAEECGVLFNALDEPPHCQFIFPSVHRQGDLVWPSAPPARHRARRPAARAFRQRSGAGIRGVSASGGGIPGRHHVSIAGLLERAASGIASSIPRSSACSKPAALAMRHLFENLLQAAGVHEASAAAAV